MSLWYILQTVSGKEEQAADLLKRKADRALWESCRVLRKRRLFRREGRFFIQEAVLFPGYVFVKSEKPEQLARFLWRSSDFPQPIELDAAGQMIPVAAEDLDFLEKICGGELEETMGISRLFLNEQNEIVRAEGILDRYSDRIVKLNMHKRFAIVEVKLFDRIQRVCFSFQLEQDQLVRQSA